MSQLLLTYCGKRFNGEKVAQLFIDSENKKYWFSGVGRVWIGSHYFAEKDAKNNVTIKARPEENREKEEHEKSDEWRAKERAALETHKSNLVRKKLDKLQPQILSEINLLKKFVLPLSFSERQAFLNWIMDEIERESREKINRELNARIQKLHRKLKGKKYE